MPGRRFLKPIIINLLVAVAYVLLGRLGLSISQLHATPVWPPSGLSLAAILLFGYQVWPGILLGSIVINSLTFYGSDSIACSIFAPMVVTFGSTMEAMLGGWLVKRFASGDAFLERAEDLFRFCYLGAFLSAGLASACGTATLLGCGKIPQSELRITAFTWWMGDAVGILVMTPLLVAWARERFLKWNLYLAIEAIGLGLLVSSIAATAFGPLQFHVEYMLIPCLVWAAFRFQKKGATLILTIIASTAIYGTLQGYGSFIMESTNDSLLLLQAFIAVIAITTLFLTAALAERRHSTERLMVTMSEMDAAKREAVEANLAKSTFLFNMNHELRTPLNHIIGYSDLLKEETADLHQADLSTDIEKINEAGKHLLSLVSQILDLSALETGQMPILPSEFPVLELIVDTVDEVRPLAEANSNRLTFQVSKECRLLKTDRDKVRQILLHVLNNACRFTRNGKIDVDVRLESQSENKQMIFAICDTGIGIAPDQVERVFRPFAQASTGSTKTYGGLGLGLAMSRLYSRLLGGDITLRSEPGKGTTVVLSLPAR